MWHKKYNKNKIKYTRLSKKFIIIVFSILFGLSYMITPVLKENTKDIPLNVFLFLTGFFIFYLSIIIVTFAVKWYHLKNKDKELVCGDKLFFLLICMLNMMIGMVYLLIYYPGVGMYDSVSILTDSNLSMAVQHPWFYCMLIRGLVNIVFFFGGDYEVAFVVQSIIQIIMTSAVSAYCLMWLKQKGLKRIVLLCLVLFTFFPIYNFYRISLFKDIPFSYLLVIWCILLYDFWESQGEFLNTPQNFMKMCVCIAFSLLRNNGLYISTFILICMLVVVKKQRKKIGILFLVLMLVIVCNTVVEKTNSITHLFKETVGIPLQQVAAVVYYDGNISNKQEEFIDKIIPIEYIKERYNPYTVDTLKWGGAPINDDYLNQHKLEFMQNWFEISTQNLDISIKAYLQTTYGFWSVGRTESKPYTSIFVENFSDWFQENEISIKSIFPKKIQKFLESMTYYGVVAMGEGQLFWGCLLLVLILCILNKRGIWIVFAPGFGGWLTIMISTPIAYQWRYVLYLALMLPLFIGMILLPKSGQSVYENSNRI